MNTAILYSFRRCPYAMRARMALKYSGIKVELREIDLDRPPEELIDISENATVPVLHLPDSTILDESWDIMQWAVKQNDPDSWLGENNQYLVESDMLLEINDYSFKEDLDHYKYADRHPEHPMEYYREQGEEFLQELENQLSTTRYLLADKLSIADIAIFPFIRQFAMVDEAWFNQAPYPSLQQWLSGFVDSDRYEAQLFTSIMKKHELWQQGDPIIYL
ncbi:MAG: glutathione S-transferase [Gammaproteobacteria bacterium]|nr:glutathione S-transferase [Gammaproteobacteria bacterium]